MRLEHITGEIIAGAIRVHSTLGPGLLENAYKLCLAHELRTRGLHVEIENQFLSHTMESLSMRAIEPIC